MKKSKFTEAQIAFAIKQAEIGTRVEEVCRKMSVGGLELLPLEGMDLRNNYIYKVNVRRIHKQTSHSYPSSY